MSTIERLTIYGVFALVLFGLCHSVPLPAGQLDPEESAGYTEGDMMLTPHQLQALTGASPTKLGRNGLIDATRRWPNRIVYYKIVGDFDLAHRNAILDGIATLQSRTCIRFQEADSSQPHYVSITSQAGGCFTAVGYQAKVQQMNLQVFPLGEGCFRPGSILHEFMHALGFYHQQSDAHRDNYIKVMYENIIPGKEFNFDKYSSTVVTDFDVGYDYNSVLHYGPGAFSVNGQNTIIPLDASAEIGQRKALSDKDIEKINVMYKCPIQV